MASVKAKKIDVRELTPCWLSVENQFLVSFHCFKKRSQNCGQDIQAMAQVVSKAMLACVHQPKSVDTALAQKQPDDNNEFKQQQSLWKTVSL